MIGWRTKRPEGAASAVPTGANAVTMPAPGSHIELMEDRLHRLNDEADWEKSHLRELLRHSIGSPFFWILSSASMFFALLNGYHGYTSSGAEAVAVTAVIIGMLYFVIELTVPVSANLMSWGGKGDAKITIRIVGFIAYCLGVGFSLLIIQSKFSAGADTASLRASTQKDVLVTSREELTAARTNATALRARVGASSPESILQEMKSLLAQPMSRKQTLGDATDECEGQRKSAKERDLCAQYDQLRRKREDAIALAKSEETIRRLSDNLSAPGGGTVSGSDAPERVLARLTGWNVESVKLLKPSMLAVMAALLTHLLWAAHGAVSNASIVKARDKLYERRALERAVKREGEKTALSEAQRAAETTAAFLAAQGTQKLVATAVMSAPLNEKPAVLQMQEYLTERAIMGDGFDMRVSVAHDDYLVWAKARGLPHIPIDRFTTIIRHLNLSISSDGRIVGAALR